MNSIQKKFLPILIFLSWFSFHPSYSQIPESSLHDTLLVGCEYDYPPYCYVNENGEAEGFAVELFQAAANEMGFAVHFQTGPWETLKYKLADEKLDALPLVGRTPEREDLFDFTIPFLTMHGTIVVRKGNDTIRQLEDLRNKRIAVLKGDNAEEFLRRNHFDKEIVQRTTYKRALIELSNGQQDAVVVQRLLALQLMKENNLDNLKIAGDPKGLYDQSFCFAVAQGDDDLQSVLNEGLAIVNANGTFRKLHTKWFAPLETGIKRKETIVIGGDFNYPPYEFLDENGEPAGYNVDLMHAIADELGINIEIKLGPWDNIVCQLEEGRIDAIQGILYSPERDEKFDMTPAHTRISYVIVSKKDMTLPQNLHQLSDKKVLVQKQDLLHEYANKQGLDEELIPVESQEEALKLLSEGAYNYAVVSRVLYHYYLEIHQWENLKAGKKSVYTADYCVGVLEGNTSLLTKFNEGLEAIEADGKYREIYSKWLGVYEKPEFTIIDFLKYASFVLIPLLLIVILSILWSRTLKKRVIKRTRELQEEIDVRKKAEKALANSQRKYKNLFNSIRDAILITDTERNIVGCNPAFEELFGYSLKEIKGKKTVYVYQSEEEYKKMGKALREHKGDARDFLFTIHYKRKDRTIFPGETNVYYLEDQEGNITGFIGLIRDVTERLKTQEALRQSKEKAEKYLNISAEIIISLDKEGKIALLNDSGYQLLGYEKGELDGKDWFSNFLPKDEYKKVQKTFYKLIAGEVEQLKTVENNIITKTGELKTILWHNSMLADNQENIAGILSSGEDITERKKMEKELIELNKELKEKNDEIGAQNEEYETLNEELLEKNEELQAINSELEEAKERADESNKLKTAFLANMSHEIRTPMNGIMGFANLLKKPDLRGEKRDLYIDLIQQSGNRMLDIIGNLLDIAKIEAGHIEIEETETSINQLLDDILYLFEGKASEKGLSIKHHKALPDEEAEVWTDKTKLTQALSNLIHNAIKYTREGWIEFGYTKEKSQDGEILQFYINDTGIGIDQDLQDKIFERFHQGETTLTREYEGAGLGLSIAKGFANSLGGDICLDSTQGKGSTFYLTIPYRRADIKDNKDQELPEKPETEKLKGANILVAEDDPNSYRLIEEMLEGYDIKIYRTETGTQTVEKVNHKPIFDVILMDIKMPEMDGYRATQLIKKQHPGLPVIAQTAFASKQDQQKALEAGCDEYITKPIKEEILIHLLVQYIKEK